MAQFDLWHHASDTAPVFTSGADLLRGFEEGGAWPGLPPVRLKSFESRRAFHEDFGATISPDGAFSVLLSVAPAGAPPGGYDPPRGFTYALPANTGREKPGGAFGFRLPISARFYEAPRIVESVPVIGVPSLDLFLEDGTGDTVIQKRLWSRFTPDFDPQDIAAIRVLLDRGLSLLMSASTGGYSQKMLNEMGNPYGFGPGKTARKLPRRFSGRSGKGSIGHVKGLRGSAPSLAITNIQSGKLFRSWQSRLILDADGYTLEWRNTAKTDRKNFPYPWAGARGSDRMRAHGPYAYMPVTMEKLIRSAHHHAVSRAYHREQMENVLAASME